MPVLKRDDTRKVIEYKMNSIEGGVMYVYDDFIQGDLEVIARIHRETLEVPETAETDMQMPDVTDRIMLRMIQSWNLTDEEGQALPLTLENFKYVSMTEKLMIQGATTWGKFLNAKSAEALNALREKKNQN